MSRERFWHHRSSVQITVGNCFLSFERKSLYEWSPILLVCFVQTKKENVPLFVCSKAIELKQVKLGAAQCDQIGQVFKAFGNNFLVTLEQPYNNISLYGECSLMLFT